MVTLQNEYYLRTILLLCEGGSYIAKLIIGRELPKYGGDLDALLKNVKTKLKHEFHKKQMEKLYPNDGCDNTDISKWDIQMLVGVILLLFRSTLSSDEKQKLREIKLIRHEVLAHSPSASLYVEKYEDVNEQLGEALNELASGFNQSVKDKCKHYISTYATHSLDVKSAIEHLKEAKDTDDLFQEVISVIRQSQDKLSQEITTAEDNIRQDLKDTKQMLSTELKSLEGCISKEVKYTQKTLSDDLKMVDCSLKATKQTLSKEIGLIDGSVALTRETLIEKIEGLEGIECNTFQALTDMSNEIKYLQQLLVSINRKGRLDKSRPPTGLKDMSERLKLQSDEVKRKILTYDESTSQPYEGVLVATEMYTGHELSRRKLLVAAIDIGTTYSGYAFSFEYDFKKDPLKISAANWMSGTGSLSSLKVPTTILFDPNGQFHSFGYEAQDYYSELALNDDHWNWYFFNRFKMRLYTGTVHRNSKLYGDNRKNMKALDVFGAAIKYMKEHLLTSIALQGVTLDSSDILWMLTVPAIWEDHAKQFMREAAFKAGIVENLTIALEPEAASIYCQTISDITKGPDDTKLECIRSGMKYMVIDLGGGTVDITVHEKQTDGRLREVYKASGEAWGGTRVDAEIYNLISAIFGEEIYSKFCDEYKDDHLGLQREIETKKRTTTARTSGKVTLKIPFDLIDTFETETQNKIKTAIDRSAFSHKVNYMRGNLQIQADTWIDLFRTCCDKLIEHISGILSHPSVEGTSVFLMVGGFSDCEIMQNSIKSAFPNVNVIVPAEPELAVMKGAVIFGHRPLAITPRVSRYTYGCSISPVFDPSIHPECRRVNIGGIDRCRDVFMKYICAGDKVKEGDARSREHATLWPHQKKIVLKLYRSAESNPLYVDDGGTASLGRLEVQLPNSNEKSFVKVKLRFGETELMVEATVLSQGGTYSARFKLP